VPSDEALQVLEIFANVTASSLENARYSAELEVRAVTDGLTGLFNHRHFQESLAAEVERAERYGLVFALLMMDLDLFKNVNDRLGTPAATRC
jgi:PleD family two-component response regulator